MKELSIEEKAKRYDEVLKESIVAHKDEDRHLKATLERIFPELKESEDERIRKALVEMVHDTTGDSLWVDYNVHKEYALAWLEKQGEQKLVQETEPTPIFKIGDILKRKGKDYTFRVDRIQGGYYHCDRNHGAFFPIEEQGLWQLVAQKPAWSEEDESMWLSVLQDLQNIKDCHPKVNVEPEFNWLKSLKDRVLPQPKPKWKPSDAQMVALDGICSYIRNKADWEISQDMVSDLYKLSEQLKKQKE